MSSPDEAVGCLHRTPSVFCMSTSALLIVFLEFVQSFVNHPRCPPRINLLSLSAAPTPRSRPAAQECSREMVRSAPVISLDNTARLEQLHPPKCQVQLFKACRTEFSLDYVKRLHHRRFGNVGDPLPPQPHPAYDAWCLCIYAQNKSRAITL